MPNEVSIEVIDALAIKVIFIIFKLRVITKKSYLHLFNIFSISICLKQCIDIRDFGKLDIVKELLPHRKQCGQRQGYWLKNLGYL